MSASPPPSAPSRLREGRAVWRGRSTRRSAGDTAYLIYIAVLVGAIAVVPLIRAMALALARPEALEVFQSAVSGTAVSVCVAAIWCAALAVGRVRGPITPTPFRAAVVGYSDIPPDHAWRRSAIHAGIFLIVSCALLAAISVSGFLVSGTSFVAAAGFVAAAAVSAIPILLVWLAGQALGRRAVTVLGMIFAVLLIMAAFMPAVVFTPAGALSVLWPGVPASQPRVLAAWVTLFVCACSAALVPTVLASLRAHTVLKHAESWEATTVLAASGDLAGALRRNRRGPTVGRRWRMRFDQPTALAIVQRDVITAARTPVRFLVAVLTLFSAGMCWGWAERASFALPWLMPIIAGLATYAALGIFSEGFRGAADSAGRIPLFGLTTGGLMWRHALWPLLLVLVLCASGAFIGGGTYRPAVVAIAVGCVTVAVRIADSAKGPLPISVMMPVPTPLGDASAIAILLWQSDALLITSAVALGFAGALSGSFAVALYAVPAIGVLALLIFSRLR